VHVEAATGIIRSNLEGPSQKLGALAHAQDPAACCQLGGIRRSAPPVVNHIEHVFPLPLRQPNSQRRRFGMPYDVGDALLNDSVEGHLHPGRRGHLDPVLQCDRQAFAGDPVDQRLKHGQVRLRGKGRVRVSTPVAKQAEHFTSSDGVEVIATTEFALDLLEHHRVLKERGLIGRIRTTYRPDDVTDP